MSDTLSPEVQELIDKQKIYELYMRYCRGVDRVDRDQIASCYHPEGTCEFGALLLEGGDNVADAISQAAGSYRLTFHMIGNTFVEIKGDVAGCEAYFLSATTVEPEDGEKQLRMRSGRYVDRIEKRDGQWKIKTRVVVEDWCKIFDLPELPAGTSFRAGQQGKADALYAMLGGLGA